jgi:YVTN family beta-propeller protein
VISHLLIPIICGLLITMSYCALINDNMEAQVSQNTLKSITNQTNVTALTKARISVGDNPVSIGGFGDYIYVANSGSVTVSVINAQNNTVVKNIPVGKYPSFIGGFGDYIYVANSGNNTVSVIDPSTNTVVKNIPVGKYPIFIGGFGDYIYVANLGSSTVSVINAQNNTVVKNIPVGKSPRFIYTSGNYTYVANSGNNTVSVIDPSTNTVVKNIPVGKSPSFIYTSGNYTYVANSGNNTLSVINAHNNTVVKNIPVGKIPSFINGFGDYIYVANSGNNTVSVIDPSTNTVVKNIPVGKYPIFIDIFGFRNYTYVANSGNNTLSVIDPSTKTVVKNITVGQGPSFIHTFGDAIYVANSVSDSVSLVDSLTNEEVAGMKFDIKPIAAGQIICDGLDTPINRFLFVSSGAKCIAKPNTGFEFSSWTQNLPRNTNITINGPVPFDSPLVVAFDSPLVVTAFREIFSGDPAATLTVNRFGNFTAYFNELPPAVPPAYLASLFTVVVTALVGSLFIPAFIGWVRSKLQTSRLNSFYQKMAIIYADGKLDENDTNQLNILNKNISDSYAAGKINNEQYMHLKNKVSTAYQKIFKKRIESFPVLDTNGINKIENEIKDAYSDGKIIELHYKLLIEQISDIPNHK